MVEFLSDPLVSAIISDRADNSAKVTQQTPAADVAMTREGGNTEVVDPPAKKPDWPQGLAAAGLRERSRLGPDMSRRTTILLTIGLLAAWALPARAMKKAEQAEAGPPKPPVPAIEFLKLEPASLTLDDGRDARQVLVWGVTQDGRKFDLSDEATFRPE